jgi:MazG family protein
MAQNHSSFLDLYQTMLQLLDPKTGCPWDLEQNHQSLLPFLFEESYEFQEAVEQNHPAKMKEELGDLLLQILLHSFKAKEAQTFSFEDVCQELNTKLISRHPHIFNPQSSEKLSSEEVLDQWQKLKPKEDITQWGRKDLYHSALESAHKIGLRARKFAFDWDDHPQVMYKVEEEWQELKEELKPYQQVNQQNVEEEIGDLLFSVVQLSRHLGVNAEKALKKGNEKFLRRFRKMMELMSIDEVDIKTLSSEKKEHYWNLAKSACR